jgi:hypothetical protein
MNFDPSGLNIDLEALIDWLLAVKSGREFISAQI